MNEWAIMDDKGIIEQGEELDISYKFQNAETEIKEWHGDLVLIEIHDRRR